MTTSSTLDPWLVLPKPNPSTRLRLFCFPYAGGGSLPFRTWPDEQTSHIEVCPVRLPGRESRLTEPPFTQLEPLVKMLAQVLLPYLDRPFAFFGHSMGALISFELAHELRKRNHSGPVHLFVSSHRAPQVPNPNSPIHHLPEPEFLEELRRLNGTPEPVLQNAELMQLLLPTLRADFTVCETYVYTHKEPLECPISALGGLQDREVSQEGLDAWREQTCRSFIRRMFPGDHFFLHTTRSLLLQAIRQDLARLLVS